MEAMFEFIFKITSRNQYVKKWFLDHKNLWEWLMEWIKEYRLPPNPLA